MKTVLGFLSSILLICFLFPGGGLAGTVKYKYDGAGRLIRIEYDNGVTIRYTYDKMGNRLTESVLNEETAGDVPSKLGASIESANGS